MFQCKEDKKNLRAKVKLTVLFKNKASNLETQGGKWNTFRRLVPLENSQKSGKSKKVGPFSRLEFPNRMSCSIYVSRSLYQFQVHGRAPRRTGVYDQMEQLFTNRKFHFCSQESAQSVLFSFSLSSKRSQSINR